MEKNNFKEAYLSRHLGVNEKLVELVLARAIEVEKRLGLDRTEKDVHAVGRYAKRRKMSEKAYDIESRSFKIIEAEVGNHPYNALEWSIVRRAIHSTADFDFAGSQRLIFGPDALASAFDAIKNKCSIVTDVEMYG